MLTDITARYEVKINELTERCNRLELANMQSELIVFGLIDDGRNCMEIANEFFKRQLELTKGPDIIYAFWKGKNVNKPMVIKLSHPSQKGIIYRNVDKLKGKKNASNKGYRIEDHLPKPLAEEQR